MPLDTLTRVQWYECTDPITFSLGNEWEHNNPPQSSSPPRFVQEAAGLASNQHFNLTSWHHQFTVSLSSFVCTHGFRSIYRSLSPLTWMKLFQLIQLLLYSLHFFLFFNGSAQADAWFFLVISASAMQGYPSLTWSFYNCCLSGCLNCRLFPSIGLFPPIFQRHFC